MISARRVFALRDRVPRHAPVAGAAVVPMVALVGMALTLQGWRSRIPAFDLLTYIRDIRDFLATGAIPAHGDIGSYGSFKPAGTAWLMLPSATVFDDPRLSEYVGAGLLYLAALAGLYLLARKYFGATCAWVAVVLYGLSATGVFLAGSLWPNGRPEFLIWMVYLASEWVTRRDPRFLAGAVVVWGVGMYVDMGITPAIFLLPALWWAYRAPVRAKPLVAAAAFVCLVWFPYLRFEAPRGFEDIRSQLTFNYLLPADYKDAWCNPDLTLRAAGAAPADNAEPAAVAGASVPPATSRSFVPRVGNAFEDKLLSNFAPIADVPGRTLLSVLLLLVVGAAAVLMSVKGSPARPSETAHRRARRTRIVLALGIVGAGIAIFLVGHFLAPAVDLPAFVRSPIETAGKLVAAGGAAWLLFRLATSCADLGLRRAGIRLQEPGTVAARRLLVIGLIVPWVVLAAVAEPEKPERFWWLWGLQVLFLSAFATDLLPRLGAPRFAVWLAIAALVAIVLPNGLVLDRIAAWRADGWAGNDAAEIRVVDRIADQLESEGKTRAAIGYELFVYRFMAAYHIKNPNYKVGADFDLLFRYRRGITNTNTCAEGFAARDDFRVEQLRPRSEVWAPRAHFQSPRDEGFELLGEVGSYRMYGRAGQARR